MFDEFGFTAFREGQREIVESIIAGNSTLAILPTGAGKSLCFQLPALMSEKPSIVISPMISLMKDQVDKLNAKKLRAGFINSAQSFRESESVLSDVINGRIKLLYLSPEKISSHNFSSRLKEIDWQYLFVDEAHCISEWGHNFRPSYRKIYDFAKEIGMPVISAFTATATPEVRKDIVLQLGMQNPKIFVSGFERPNLKLNVLRPKDKKSKLAAILRSGGLPAVVYCSTRKETEEVADFLRLHGFAVNHYHAGLSAELRKLVQEDFIDDKLEVIVATNAFGMGIDKKDIRTIVHYNIPASLEHYYQEIGRAGRDGLPAEIFLLYSKRDFSVHEYLIENSYPSDEEIKAVYSGLADYMTIALGSFFEKAIAIDKSVLKFFEKKNITSAKLENALKSLEESGYVQLSKPQGNEYKIQYLLSPRDLKIYIKKIAKKEYAEILYALARLYLSAPFSEPVKISLHNVSGSTGLRQNDVREKLRELDLLGILKFEEPNEFVTARLITTRVRTADLQISNERNEELIGRAKEKLRKMKSYAETEKCRMGFILEYFGGGKNYKCGVCDNCLNKNKRSETITDYVEEVVFETVSALNENISVKKLLDLLIGRGNDDAIRVLPNYGALNDFSTIEIYEAVERLKENGNIAIENKTVIVPEKKKSLQKSNADYGTELKIFNKLVELRKETAKKFNQPVYMICSDEILREISKRKPANEFELLSLRGFNRNMFNKFGAEILKIVAEFSSK